MSDIQGLSGWQWDKSNNGEIVWDVMGYVAHLYHYIPILEPILIISGFIQIWRTPRFIAIKSSGKRGIKTGLLGETPWNLVEDFLGKPQGPQGDTVTMGLDP